jgi:cyclomaltodextrinase
MTFVGNHDVTRIASKLLDPQHLPHALVALLTVPGVPSIYAGDEQAFRGVKEDRAGGDDAIRPVFPARPSELAPWGQPTYRLHQDLIALRRRHPWLQSARIEIEMRTNPVLVYECRSAERGLRVVLNVGSEPYTLPHAGRRLLASAKQDALPEGTALIVEPHGFAICESL